MQTATYRYALAASRSGRGFELFANAEPTRQFADGNAVCRFMREREIDAADVRGVDLLMESGPPVDMGSAISREIPNP